MNKAQIKKIVEKDIVALTTADHTNNVSYWYRARAVHNIQKMFVWKNTPYKSFSNFAKEELSQYTLASLYTWSANWALITRLGYDMVDIQVFSHDLGPHNIVVYAHTLGRKTPVKQFVKKAKAHLATINSSSVNGKASATLHLTPEYMEKFEDMLTHFGYRKDSKTRRTGISDAMCNMIDWSATKKLPNV